MEKEKGGEMMTAREAIKEFQCPGCGLGSSPGSEDDCFEVAPVGIGCGKHSPGTMIFPTIGKIFLGMPRGFNRMGPFESQTIRIFETQKQQEESWPYDRFNIPCWKQKTIDGIILIRGFSPRTNIPFIHIILEGDFNTIPGIEINPNDKSFD